MSADIAKCHLSPNHVCERIKRFTSSGRIRCRLHPLPERRNFGPTETPRQTLITSWSIFLRSRGKSRRSSASFAQGHSGTKLNWCNTWNGVITTSWTNSLITPMAA
uniref:(northern house mosquito) hypothetical protein n=1 Tax=Culex pipiens TaxID=7175 RepID=A0A8D8A418_CULPI